MALCCRHYGWVMIVALCLFVCGAVVGQDVALGAFGASFEEVGVTPGLLGLSAGLGRVVAACLTPWAGAYMDRQGSTYVVYFLALLASGTVASIAMTTEPLLLMVGVTVLVAFTSCSTLVLSTAVSKWFCRLRGLVFGGVFLTESTYLLFPGTYDFLRHALGQRTALLLSASFALVMLGFASLLWVGAPSDVDLAPDLQQLGEGTAEETLEMKWSGGDDTAEGEPCVIGRCAGEGVHDGGQPPTKQDHPRAIGTPLGTCAYDFYDFTLQEAKHTTLYWALLVQNMLVGSWSAAFFLHYPNLLAPVPTAEVDEAFFVSAFMNMCLAPVLGWLVDCAGRRTYLIMVAAGLVCCALLAVVSGEVLLRLPGVAQVWLISVLVGLLLPLENVVFIAMAQTFGREHIGAIEGASSTFRLVGSAVCPPLAGFCFDLTGSYKAVTWPLLGALLLSSLVLAAQRAPQGSTEV